jgi:hypothetical protein
MQFQSSMSILSHCLRFDPSNLFNRRTAQDRAGAAKEGGIPEVVARLNNVVEEVLLWCYPVN